MKYFKNNNCFHVIVLMQWCLYAMQEKPFHDPHTIATMLCDIKESLLSKTAKRTVLNEQIRFWDSEDRDPKKNCVTHFSCSAEEEALRKINILCQTQQPISFLVTPQTSPQNLAETLIARGFSSTPLAALYYSLETDITYVPGKDIFIQKMEQRTPEWQELYEPGSSKKNQSLPSCDAASQIHKGIWEDYGLFYQNQLVSIASLFLKDNWIGILNGVTKEEFRVRGFATKLGTFILKAAKDRGYKHVIMPAVPISEQIAQKKFGAIKVCNFSLLYRK